MELPDGFQAVPVEVQPLDREAAGIGEEVLDPVGAKLLIELAYELNKRAGDEWDQAHQLVFIRGVRQRFDVEELGMDGELFGVELYPVPDFMRLYSAIEDRGGRMHHALLEVARVWGHHAQEHHSAQVLGAAVVFEGWQTHGESEQRYEARMINLSGRNGLRVAFSQPRDGAPLHLVDQALPGLGKQLKSSGDIANALHYLMEVIEGRNPEPFETWQTKYDYWTESP